MVGKVDETEKALSFIRYIDELLYPQARISSVAVPLTSHVHVPSFLSSMTPWGGIPERIPCRLAFLGRELR